MQVFENPSLRGAHSTVTCQTSMHGMVPPAILSSIPWAHSGRNGPSRKTFRNVIHEVHLEVQPTMATALRSSNWTERGGGTKVGSTPDGSVVDLYVLEHEGIDAAIMTYGARLTSLRTPDRYGKMEDVILNYSVLDSYLADRSCYLGAIVGRYANRIASGRICVGDRTYQAVTNDRGHVLHGGNVGFDQQVWSARPMRSGVELTLTSPDGDQGFP